MIFQHTVSKIILLLFCVLVVIFPNKLAEVGSYFQRYSNNHADNLNIHKIIVRFIFLIFAVCILLNW
jgi:hypothetical protein